MGLVGRRVDVEYDNGKYEVALAGIVEAVTPSFALVSYLRRDRHQRVRQVGKESWHPRTSAGVARESYLLADIASGAVRLRAADRTSPEAGGRGR